MGVSRCNYGQTSDHWLSHSRNRAFLPQKQLCGEHLGFFHLLSPQNTQQPRPEGRLGFYPHHWPGIASLDWVGLWYL